MYLCVKLKPNSVIQRLFYRSNWRSSIKMDFSWHVRQCLSHRAAKEACNASILSHFIYGKTAWVNAQTKSFKIKCNTLENIELSELCQITTKKKNTFTATLLNWINSLLGWKQRFQDSLPYLRELIRKSNEWKFFSSTMACVS